jgi:hypothetical protein
MFVLSVVDENFSGFNDVCAFSGKRRRNLDSETHVVTSSILRICRHRLRRMSVRALWVSPTYCVIRKKILLLPKYLHLLTSVLHIWPFVLFKKIMKILFTLLCYGLSSYICQVYHNYFTFLQFFIGRMVKYESHKSKGANILRPTVYTIAVTNLFYERERSRRRLLCSLFSSDWIAIAREESVQTDGPQGMVHVRRAKYGPYIMFFFINSKEDKIYMKM